MHRIIISLASCVIATDVSLCNDRSFVVRRSRCLVASVVLFVAYATPASQHHHTASLRSRIRCARLLIESLAIPGLHLALSLSVTRSPWSSAAHARLRPSTGTASTTTSASAVARRSPSGPARPASDGWASPRSNNAVQMASHRSTIRTLHCHSNDTEHDRHRLLPKRRLPSSATVPGYSSSNSSSCRSSSRPSR